MKTQAPRKESFRINPEREKSKETDLSPGLKKIFEIVERENNELKNITLRKFPAKDAYDAGGYYNLEETKDGSVVPCIYISEGKPEMFRDLLEARKTSVKLNAELLGINPEEITPELLQIFIVAHELGHIKDFVSNYQSDPELPGWSAAEEMYFPPSKG